MELAKMFLNQINYWQLETPSQRRQSVPSDDVAGYKVNYTRLYQADINSACLRVIMMSAFYNLFMYTV